VPDATAAVEARPVCAAHQWGGASRPVGPADVTVLSFPVPAPAPFTSELTFYGDAPSSRTASSPPARIASATNWSRSFDGTPNGLSSSKSLDSTRSERLVSGGFYVHRYDRPLTAWSAFQIASATALGVP
jgi:hypothetical protein